MDILVANKVDLVEWLSGDSNILQQALGLLLEADGIIEHRLYKQLIRLQPEAACIQLIDTMINRGEETASDFIKLLQKTGILHTYPQLKDIFCAAR